MHQDGENSLRAAEHLWSALRTCSAALACALIYQCLAKKTGKSAKQGGSKLPHSIANLATETDLVARMFLIP
jgi:hypothetical protein